MARIVSRWRQRAREVIQRVLSSLPADTTPALIRKAISDAYPFGERAHHPYACWLREVKQTLRRDGRTAHLEPDLPEGVSYEIRHQPRPWWLVVLCGFCNGKIAGGCMACSGHHRTVRELVALPDWPHWLGQLEESPEVAGIFADWLDDRGFPEVGEALRKAEAP